MSLLLSIQQYAKDFHQETISLRRHIHAHPELAFEEHDTAALVANKLEEWGVSYQSGVAKTGVVGVIKGRNPEKHTIALRADMDALPILETNDVPYKSTETGLMHACGHDVHTASLLGTAYILSRLQDQFEGTVKLIFQPSEEKLPGGASVMIKEGVLERPKPSGIFGQHVFPELEAGKVGFRPGMYMASADEIYITVTGKGGHAALPHKVNSPILMASRMLLELDEWMQANTTDERPSVLAFGDIQGHGATNVIPNEVKIQGTFRTMNEEWRAEVHEKIKALAENVCNEMGGSCDFDIHKGYPFLLNDEDLTRRAKQNAIEYLGAENVIDLDMRMTAEDFAFYTQHMPACFYRLGTADNERGINSPVHTSTFDIDEKALETSIGLMAYLAVRELGR